MRGKYLLVPMMLMAAGPAMAAESPFAGRWRVAGVAVSDIGVQALVDNDPSLMNRRLTFAPSRLSWDQAVVTNDECVGPRFTRMKAAPPADLVPQLRKLGMPRPTAYIVRCRSGGWGPGENAQLYVGRGGVVAMPWYDGGLLKLVRR